jgi:hypothetical protein
VAQLCRNRKKAGNEIENKEEDECPYYSDFVLDERVFDNSVVYATDVAFECGVVENFLDGVPQSGGGSVESIHVAKKRESEQTASPGYVFETYMVNTWLPSNVGGNARIHVV